MRHPETRALWRAVTVLVVISMGRWGWSARPEQGTSAEGSVLPELLATSRQAAAEAARRATPLAEGERLDPNRATEVELDRLPGVGPATALAIVAARDRGLVFRKPEDLLEVRGIGEATLDRIRSLLDLSGPPLGVRTAPVTALSGRRSSAVDLNRADAEALQTLPGIGPALAERIVAARKEQMFTSVDDLVRVRGIGRATVARLRPYASIGLGP